MEFFRYIRYLDRFLVSPKLDYNMFVRFDNGKPIEKMYPKDVVVTECANLRNYTFNNSLLKTGNITMAIIQCFIFIYIRFSAL